MADAVALKVTDPKAGFQYIRNFQFFVADKQGNFIDLTPMHCKFSVKRTSSQTPNGAEIRVYNLKPDTANALRQELSPGYNKSGILVRQGGTAVIEGGYNSNYGVIFRGTIKQVIIGRESATDTFVDFICSDGDIAYNYAVINGSIAHGATVQDQIDQIAAPMADLGSALAKTQPAFKPTLLPRGKTLWGNSRDYLRTIAQQNNQIWSIQNGKIQFQPQQSYLPNEAVTLTSKTGMIGTPEQTTLGVNVVCLMNPRIQPGGLIKIDNKSVAKLKINLANPNDPSNFPPDPTLDGTYCVYVIEQQGDNRGVEWYSKLICGTVDLSSNLLNQIPVTYGP
jgi:hypothetical protein